MKKPYLKNRTIEKHETGFFVIEPENSIDIVPLFCSICKSLFRIREDDESYVEFGCCYRCALQWAHSRRDVWKKKEYRPTQSEIDDVVSKRSRLYFKIEFDLVVYLR